MAKLPIGSLALLALATLIAGTAFAGKGPDKKEAEKKAKEGEIKALEEQIHHLREQEKAALKGIDERYNHIIRNLDPKEVHHQLEEILVVMRQVREDLGHADNLNFGGNRMRARESAEQAEHQVEKALKHDTPEERAITAHDIKAVHEDILKGLAFSEEHPLAGGGPDELQRRAVANKRLVDALPAILQAHQLLVAVDHEIKDYKEEKHALNERREHDKKETKEQLGKQIKGLEEQIKSLKK
jgi:hypothetical protein